MVGIGGEHSTRAVSEATAMAILVGFTVVVTASAGVGVLFLEDDGNDVPATNFTFRHYSGNAMLVVEHGQGDPIPAERVQFSSQGTTATWADIDESRNGTDAVDQGAALQLNADNAWGEPVRSGDVVEVYYDHGDGNTTMLSAWTG